MGSHQFQTMRNLRESLAGRVGLFELLPMSLFEGPRQTQTYEDRALRGSYPEILTQSQHTPERWYASYVATYLEKDVQPHYRLEKITHFRDFLFLLASRTAQILNYHSLSSDLGVSVPAIKSWVRILEASRILFLLRPYYVNLGSRVIKSPKIYFTDIGLACYLTATTDSNTFKKGPLAGPLFENFVIQETLKSYTNRGIIPPLFYFRSNNGLEVDLIVEEKPGVIRPCEIKANSSPKI